MPSNLDSSAPSPNFLKSSNKCNKFKKLSTRNFFLHSEFSPFQTWKDYNRFLFDREVVPDVLSPNQFPRWYDSPFYKELTAAHRNQTAQLEEKRYHRKQTENVVPAELHASTVRQKASAIEKRCESATATNCPPWRRSQEPVKNKFPPNRPCTASPFSDKSRRKEDGLFSTGRASALHHKVQTVVDEQTSNSGTPFSISKLLTPVIHSRQETETSEILQYAISPTILDLPPSFESEPKQPPEVKPRNKYKAMASSLLFNLKDNRKRVKSTYTPTTFKSLEIADHSKQPSQLDSLISKEGMATPEIPESWATASIWQNGKDLRSVNSPALPPTNMQTVNYVKRAESCQSQDYFTLISPQTVNEGSNYRSVNHTAQESEQVKDDKLAETQSGRCGDLPLMASKSNETPLRKKTDYSLWKPYETGSPQGQGRKHLTPDVQVPPHSFTRKEERPAPPTEEKSDTRREVPALFEEENTKVPANKQKDRVEIAARDRPNHNIEGRRIYEPQNQSAAPALPLQVKGYRGASVSSRKPARVNMPSRESYLSVGDAPQSPEEESKAHPTLRTVQSPIAKSVEERNTMEEVKRDMGKLEALQYYAISNRECKTERHPSQRHERMQRKGESELPHNELNEGSWAHGLLDYAKAHTPTPRSSSSSPSLGKILFKVKDNTLRASPVTKTVKPCFHKTFGDDFRLSSSRESLSGSEKGDDEGDRLKECSEVPVLHNAAAMSVRAPRSREAPSHNVSQQYAVEFITAREPRSYYRRNHHLEQDERNSAISAMSQDQESFATGTAGTVKERVPAAVHGEEAYERPESACSDMVRPLGKPPSVPPKSEKALRRAKKLATRRIKKSETPVDSPIPMEHKPLRAVASMPSSPTEVMLSQQPLLAPPLLPQFCVEPSYIPPAPSIMAQPFPITQRKLLQDPNSGQYFMVNMPVPVKTKMFFDPETGKYVQLSVQQTPQGTLSNASSMELLSPPPYMLYPGFLPMPVSSLPPLRSASQLSAPATLMGDQEKRSDPWRQEAYGQNYAREAQPYIEPVYASCDQLGQKSSYGDDEESVSPRNLDIIPMSELEDFAMEST
ncbi:hypothetical protein AAFF_G00138840 [Aldrovandia affinis]|uniref:DUF4585 domain-containing protein n=1 Tax=Aldrovandia affinis TaxID=143900 RepID=A0AAD7TC46_9TELE|nr:hypothetical protein AAFF_G00138840 [Aldrovandia affinis]